MKWVLWNEIRRVIVLPYTRLYFLFNGVQWGKGWKILGTPMIQRYSNSRIQIGKRFFLRSWVSSNPVAPYHPAFLSTRKQGAIISIGDDCGITGGSIIAEEQVKIGNRVLIGANCLIMDSDFHPIHKAARIKHPKDTFSKPVTIADDVFIGTQVILLKGTTIGEGSIIGAGSVVSGAIPANVVAAGNPAVVIRQINQ